VVLTIDTRFFITHFLANTDDLKLKARRKMVALQQERSIVPTIVLHEVYKFFADLVGMDAADLRVGSILKSNFAIVDLTYDIAIASAQLRNKYRGLPTADSIIAATAIKRKSKHVLSDDPHFKSIREIKSQWL
jgi:predicted nucleic acid-binding protein